MPFDRVGAWTLTVMPWSGAGEGYELFFSEIQPVLSPRLQIVSTAKRDLLMVNVTLDQNASREAWPSEVRLWAEGLGFIARKTFDPVTIFKWKSPFATANIRLRAQFLADGSPMSGATPARASALTTTAFKGYDSDPAHKQIVVSPRRSTALVSNQAQRSKRNLPLVDRR